MEIRASIPSHFHGFVLVEFPYLPLHVCANFLLLPSPSPHLLKKRWKRKGREGGREGGGLEVGVG